MSSPPNRLRGTVGFGALLRRNRDVRLLWGGTVVSLFGDWFNTLALYRLALDLTGSEAALGGVFLTKLIPLALASPIAGVLADRLDRRKLMIGADLVRAALVLGFLFIREVDDLWLLYVLGAAQIAVSAAFTPAKNAVLPRITGPGELLTANALLSATWSTMLAVGAAAGGPAVDAFGTDVVFVLDAATYLVSAALIARIAVPKTEAQTTAEDGVVRSVVGTAVAQVADGWRYVRQRPAVARFVFAKAAWGIGGGGLMFSLALLGDSLFPSAGTTGIGILFAARGLGTGLGPVLTRALFQDERRWPTVLAGCTIACGLGYLGIAVAGDARWAVAALVVFAHGASGANWVLSTTLLQDRAADTFRGRVISTDWLLVTLVESVSIVVAGLLLEGGLALGALIAGLAGVQIVAGLSWGLWVIPAERRVAAAAS
ncbi:MFS transporter [Rubrivirga sp. IMCC45206]|uniref:MFS transporter n=1 Tax=Rubrivirga sp. IMCC45206 TaxID=3391614 RepID=UPI00398FA8E1